MAGFLTALAARQFPETSGGSLLPHFKDMFEADNAAFEAIRFPFRLEAQIVPMTPVLPKGIDVSDIQPSDFEGIKGLLMHVVRTTDNQRAFVAAILEAGPYSIFTMEEEQILTGNQYSGGRAISRMDVHGYIEGKVKAALCLPDGSTYHTMLRRLSDHSAASAGHASAASAAPSL